MNTAHGKKTAEMLACEVDVAEAKKKLGQAEEELLEAKTEGDTARRNRLEEAVNLKQKTYNELLVQKNLLLGGKNSSSFIALQQQ
jgi:hypothetical protein